MEKKKNLNIKAISTSKKNIFISHSPEETKAIGEKFASYLKKGDIIFLKGDLGSGKTTLSQGIVKAFGNKGFARSSSFMLVNEYKAKDGMKLFHMDLYRLNPSNVWDIGIEEYLYSDNITLIEWADRLKGAENENHWNIEIEYLDPERKIIIEKMK